MAIGGNSGRRSRIDRSRAKRAECDESPCEQESYGKYCQPPLGSHIPYSLLDSVAHSVEAHRCPDFVKVGISVAVMPTDCLTTFVNLYRQIR